MIHAVLVHQKELLYGFMTPREHLLFHAIARMSRSYSSAEMHARVEEVGGRPSMERWKEGRKEGSLFSWIAVI